MTYLFKKNKAGFTLVEIIVSMAITCILLLGISMFFTSSFQQLFKSQYELVNSANQFAVNEIIKNKFTTLSKILNDFTGGQSSSLLFINKNTKGQFPFSYVGAVSENDSTYLALKDFLVFNKIYHNTGSDFFADSGAGMIRRVDNGAEVTPKLNPNEKFKNFSSFEITASDYYIVFPYQNRVMKCPCENGSCEYDGCKDLPDVSQFSSPTDIVKDKDGKYLYISDSGNGKIIKYDINNQKQADFFTGAPTINGLNYPTGLAYYYDAIKEKEFLFVSETFGNKVRKINLTSPSVIDVVAGDGDDAECMHTAKFCKLNMPTGLYADDVNQELFISDSGNNRILRMKDPGDLDSLTFNFSLDDNYALDKIEFINSSWVGGGIYNESYGNLIGTADDFYSNTFKNPDRLTTYEGNTVCKSSAGSFYVNENTAESLNSGDKLIIDNSVYTVSNPPTSATDCIEDDGLTRKEWLVNIEGSGIVPGGKTVFFSNPSGNEKVNVKIDGIGNPPKITFSDGGGYKTFTIKTYDINKGPVETDYATFLAGDGILGTPEDAIQVFNSGLNFPTGVTSGYFADSGAKSGLAKIKRMDGAPVSEPNLDIIDTGMLTNFDYVSDFTLNKDNPIIFQLLNSGSLVEMTENAELSGDKIQTYKINASVSSGF